MYKYSISIMTNHAPALLKAWQACILCRRLTGRENLMHFSRRGETCDGTVLNPRRGWHTTCPARCSCSREWDTDISWAKSRHRCPGPFGPPLTSNQGKAIFFLAGRDVKHTQLTRYIPVHAIYDHLTMKQEKILLSVYCTTGCDTVSAFFGHGKRTAFRVVMQKADQLQDLALLGSKGCADYRGSQNGSNKVCWLHAWQGELHITECRPGEKAGKKNILGNKLSPMHWRCFYPAPASLCSPAAGMGSICSTSGNTSRCNSIWIWKMFRWYPSTATDDEPVPGCSRTAQWSCVWLPARRMCNRLFRPGQWSAMHRSMCLWDCSRWRSWDVYQPRWHPQLMRPRQTLM